MDCLSKFEIEEEVVVGGMKVEEDVRFGSVVGGVKICCFMD